VKFGLLLGLFVHHGTKDSLSSFQCQQMSKAEFIRNNRGIDDGRDIGEDFMGALYDRIVSNEIKMKADSTMPSKQQPANVNRMPGLDAILNIVVRKPREESKIMETSEDVIRHMQEQFKAKAGKSE
jgi:brefeldin A-inhibited guanine nucleotide-exchange protein